MEPRQLGILSQQRYRARDLGVYAGDTSQIDINAMLSHKRALSAMLRNRCDSAQSVMEPTSLGMVFYYIPSIISGGFMNGLADTSDCKKNAMLWVLNYVPNNIARLLDIIDHMTSSEWDIVSYYFGTSTVYIRKWIAAWLGNIEKIRNVRSLTKDPGEYEVDDSDDKDIAMKWYDVMVRLKLIDSDDIACATPIPTRDFQTFNTDYFVQLHGFITKGDLSDFNSIQLGESGNPDTCESEGDLDANSDTDYDPNRDSDQGGSRFFQSNLISNNHTTDDYDIDGDHITFPDRVRHADLNFDARSGYVTGDDNLSDLDFYEDSYSTHHSDDLGRDPSRSSIHTPPLGSYLVSLDADRMIAEDETGSE